MTGKVYLSSDPFGLFEVVEVKGDGMTIDGGVRCHHLVDPRRLRFRAVFTLTESAEDDPAIAVNNIDRRVDLEHGAVKVEENDLPGGVRGSNVSLEKSPADTAPDRRGIRFLGVDDDEATVTHERGERSAALLVGHCLERCVTLRKAAHSDQYPRSTYTGPSSSSPAPKRFTFAVIRSDSNGTAIAGVLPT